MLWGNSANTALEMVFVHTDLKEVYILLFDKSCCSVLYCINPLLLPRLFFFFLKQLIKTYLTFYYFSTVLFSNR